VRDNSILMQIYLDESGSFVPPRQPNRVSAVGALVVPDRQGIDLFAKFEALTTRWATNGEEVKGSTLSEIQIAGVIELVGQYDCLFDVRGIDMGLHDVARIGTFQDRQASAVTAEITASHHHSWREWAAATEGRMRSLSPQLFTQAMLTIYLVLDLLQTATIYYVQRRPEELGQFRWRVDPKDPTHRTELEMLWTDVILPMGQTQSIKEPFATIPGCDYSYFGRFYVDRDDMPADLARHAGERRRRDGGIDVEKILQDLTFPDSRTESGLQITDILLSAFCRALNGTLGERGWTMLGRLMTTTQDSRSRLVFLRLDPAEKLPGGRRPYASTLTSIESETRDILTPGRRR
jgi:hypothetical protein